jgi:hypothetical protein
MIFALFSRLRLRLAGRGIPARMSSLIMLLQRSPVLPLLPQARVISTSGFSEAIKWSVTAILGLGAYDSVTGASAVTQVLPTPGSSTVNIVAGDPLLFLFQLTGETYIPAVFEVQGTLPAGLVQTRTENSTTDTITGAATEAGSFPITLIAWETPAMNGFSARSPFTINVTLPPVPTITASPTGGNFSAGDFVSLNVGHTSGKSFTWKLNNEALPVAETVLFPRTGARKYRMAPATNPGDGWRNGNTFDETGWISVSGGIGYDTDPLGVNYIPHIATPNGNTQAAMSGSGKPVAVHLRMPFTISNSRALSYLKLRVQSDDGFVAYLNGTELPSPQNKPAAATFQWNSGASGTANDNTAITFREIDLSSQLGLLRTGGNLLAVQAMNQTNTSSDFLFNCELVAGINATNSARLLLTNLQMADAGNYTVTVSNPAGAVTSNPAPVLLKPQITGHPESGTVNAGSTTELHVTAAGSPPFSYQWYTGASGDTSNPIAGATDESFTTSPLAATISFWVRVTSPAGTADSNAATITVVVAGPVISTQPGSVTIDSGATTVLTVVATGTEPLTYQWFSGLSGDTANSVQGATAISFTTPALTATASFWVRVTSPDGSTNSATATVTVVNVPPAISTQPASVGINDGGTATLTVAATGTAPFTYQWYRGVSGDTSNPIPEATAASFTTPPLNMTTSYWVRVTNAAASVDSTTAVVSVNATADPFSAWQHNQFTEDQLLNEQISGSTADPDGDGLTNEVEYILGTLPLVSTPSPAPAVTMDGAQPTLTFTAVRSTGPGYDGRNRSYTLESAPSVIEGPWVPVDSFIDISANGQTVTYTPPPGDTRRFFRLKVRLSP